MRLRPPATPTHRQSLYPSSLRQTALRTACASNPNGPALHSATSRESRTSAPCLAPITPSMPIDTRVFPQTDSRAEPQSPEHCLLAATFLPPPASCTRQSSPSVHPLPPDIPTPHE